MTIAITGATGQLGRLVIQKLKTKTSAGGIVALARDPAKAADLGVAVRQADYTAKDSLEQALKGVDTLLLISGNELGQRATQHKNVFDAAKKNGVKKIVYTSLLHADTSSLNLAPEHVQTEHVLKNSGITYTILRNGWYTENYTASAPTALENGAFYGSAGNGKISSAPRADYAEAAAVVLTTAGHDGKTYEFAGDNAYTLSDLAAEIAKQSGQEIPYANIPEEAYAQALTAAGLPEGLAAAIASWDVGASNGALFATDKTLSTLLERPTTTLAASVTEALK